MVGARAPAIDAALAIQRENGILFYVVDDHAQTLLGRAKHLFRMRKFGNVRGKTVKASYAAVGPNIGNVRDVNVANTCLLILQPCLERDLDALECLPNLRP